jgi:hypothetical protein
MKILSLFASSYKILSAGFLALAAASCAHAWSSTVQVTPASGYVYTEVDLPAYSNPSTHQIYLPNYNTANPPEFYFCLEMTALQNTVTTAAKAQLRFWAASQTPTPIPTGTYINYDLGTFTPVSGQTNVHTFANPATLPSGYTILAPTNHTSLQYKVGYRIHGKVRGPTTANTGFLFPYLPTQPNYSIKLTISDKPLLENWEPDVVAQPVTNAGGEPSITIGGVADKTTITSPIPASYTLAWNAAGAASFKVTGGNGNGAIAAAGITSGTSRAFTNVAQSTQNYVLTTQGPAAIAWKLSSAATWEIFSGTTPFGSGTGTTATANVTIKGAYILRVNGINKTAEDEVINVTDGFLKRSKTMNLTIGSP